MSKFNLSLVAENNGFSGTVPNFVSNPNIHYVNLQNNHLLENTSFYKFK